MMIKMFNEFKLKMLNKEASSPKNKPAKIIKSLNIKRGMVIGDIGSGGGYFSSKFSTKVGEQGQVYAIDVNQKFLNFIGESIRKSKIKNVKTVLADVNGPDLPDNSVNLFFLRNVFHHLPKPAEYFKNIEKILEDNGKIAIIDYKKKKFSFAGLFGHYTPENVLIDIMSEVGFYPIEKHDFLPDQLFVIFQKR